MTKRTFIAFDIIPSPETKAVYDLIRQKLRQEKISWVDDKRFHLTIKFLGDTSQEMIPDITDTLKNKLSTCRPFEVTLTGFGIFRNLRDPRVIWLGCRADNKLEQVKNAIDDALIPLGFEPENRRFSPHCTIGRIKQIRQVNHLSELITGYSGTEFQHQKVKNIIFYESHLKPTGSVYTPIEIFNLL